MKLDSSTRLYYSTVLSTRGTYVSTFMYLVWSVGVVL